MPTTKLSVRGLLSAKRAAYAPASGGGATVGAQTALLTSTGGIITTSTKYINANNELVQFRYHIFTSNGTFTPSGSGRVDILLVGGGGGGAGGVSGGYSGDGGHGGKVTTVLNANVTATGYTVTVGSGGAAGIIGGNGGAGSNSSVAGISGAAANGGIATVSTGTCLAGNGAGGGRTGTANASSAQIGGVGANTNFCVGITTNVTSFPLTIFTDSYSYPNAANTFNSDVVYFGGGGASTYVTSGNEGLYYGYPGRGGGGGSSLASTSSLRGVIPNTGGGGFGGYRASGEVSAGSAGASGIVMIRYRM